MLMVGMEGSAVLAVRKVVVVAREAEREVAEGAEAGSAGTLQPPRLLHRHPAAGCLQQYPDTEFRTQRCELAVNV